MGKYLYLQSASIQAHSLLPGSLIQLSILPTTVAGVESKAPYRNKQVKVTCGCPIDQASLRSTEATGRPRGFAYPQDSPQQLDVVQKRGKMYLSWTDTSLCESGFGFSRGGLSFTPDYLVESPKTCFSQHSPSLIYDDLTTNSVALGSTQKYCTRAINSVGYDSGYLSDPLCMDIVVAWEAAVLME